VQQIAAIRHDLGIGTIPMPFATFKKSEYDSSYGRNAAYVQQIAANWACAAAQDNSAAPPLHLDLKLQARQQCRQMSSLHFAFCLSHMTRS
jgi:hypothetical protein